MKERNGTVYLKHILDAIARIEGYLFRVNQETFIKTPATSRWGHSVDRNHWSGS